MKRKHIVKMFIAIGLATTMSFASVKAAIAETLPEEHAYLQEDAEENSDGTGSDENDTPPLIGGGGDTRSTENTDQPTVVYVPSPASNISKNPSTKTGSSALRFNVSGTLYLAPKKTQTVTVSGLASGDSVFSWKSSKPSVVKVSSTGKLTAKKAGSARITVTTKKGSTASLSVVVRKPTLKVSRTKVVLTAKQKGSISFSGLVSGDRVTSCKSSNSKVATVTRSGVIKAKKKGTAKITIKTKFGAKATFKVTVKKAF